MDFHLQQAQSLLAKTPKTIHALLSDLDEHWLQSRESETSWNAHQIMAHLVYAETLHWPSRVRATLSPYAPQTFAPFDMQAQWSLLESNSMQQLLHTFSEQRGINLDMLETLELSDADLDKVALHPSLGSVTLRNVIATWTAHDMAHLVQLGRTFARAYTDAVGPWSQNMSLLRKA